MQLKQKSIPRVSEYRPAGQAMHVDAPAAGAYWPSAHGVQADKPAVDANCPTAQDRQAVPPTVYLPAVQLVHSVSTVEFTAAVDLPAGHSMHTPALAVEYCPNGHPKQVVDPTPANFPAAHAEHVTPAVAENWPAAQSAQALEVEPAGQL